MQFSEHNDPTQIQWSYPVPTRRSTAAYAAPSAVPTVPTIAHRRLGQPHRPRHPVIHTLFGMCVVLALYFLWSLLIFPTWINLNNQWHYGDSLVSVFGPVDVGHGGESEFIAFTDHNKLYILEIVGKNSQAYTGNIQIVGSHVVTLGLEDVNRDGKVDLVITISGEQGSFVLFNTGKSFSWSQPS